MPIRLPVDNDDRDRRFATAVHESAHAIVATILGGAITLAELTLDEPNSAGRCTYATLPEQHALAVTYAGAYAEARWEDGRNVDHRAIRAALQRHPSDRAVLRASAAPLPRHVEPIIERSWRSILALAEGMFHTGHVGPSQVSAALMLPAENPQRAHALAVIRSGSAPGSFTVSS